MQIRSDHLASQKQLMCRVARQDYRSANATWREKAQKHTKVITGHKSRPLHGQRSHFAAQTKASPSVPSQSDIVGHCCSLRSAFRGKFSSACFLPSAGQTLVKCRSMQSIADKCRSSVKTALNSAGKRQRLLDKCWLANVQLSVRPVSGCVPDKSQV